MSNNYCKYCQRYFRFNDLYEQHNITCEFFYKKARERDREIDLQETLPSAMDQFHLIQHLALEVSRLKKQVERLQTNNIVKKKKMISEYINSEGFFKPQLTFDDWIKTFHTSFESLNYVFEGDLMDGIMHVLRSTMNQETYPPLVAFHQKAQTFYVYTKDPKDDHRFLWRIMTQNEYEKMYNRIGHKLLQEFLKWQIHNADKINSDPDLKEKNISYMYKINGCGQSYEDRRRSEGKRILFQKIAQDFTQNVVYEYL